MNRKQAINEARGNFPLTIWGNTYQSLTSMQRKDAIAADLYLDHIQYNEPY